MTDFTRHVYLHERGTKVGSLVHTFRAAYDDYCTESVETVQELSLTRRPAQRLVMAALRTPLAIAVAPHEFFSPLSVDIGRNSQVLYLHS